MTTVPVILGSAALRSIDVRARPGDVEVDRVEPVGGVRGDDRLAQGDLAVSARIGDQLGNGVGIAVIDIVWRS